MVIEYVTVAVSVLTVSVTVTCTLDEVPAAVGVPERTPAPLRERPAGRPVAAQLYVPEPPEAANCTEL